MFWNVCYRNQWEPCRMYKRNMVFNIPPMENPFNWMCTPWMWIFCKKEIHIKTCRKEKFYLFAPLIPLDKIFRNTLSRINVMRMEVFLFMMEPSKSFVTVWHLQKTCQNPCRIYTIIFLKEKRIARSPEKSRQR